MFFKIVFVSLTVFSLESGSDNITPSYINVSTSSDEDGKILLGPLVQYLTHTSQRKVNMSVIVWQHVYDDSGNIDEVEAFELFFPVKDESGADLFDGFADTFKDRSQQRKFSPKFPSLFESADVFIESRKPGKNSELFYWSPSTTYYRPSDGIVTFNQTKTSTRQEVDGFVEDLKKREGLALEPLIVKYDVDGNIKLGESTMVLPSIVSYVVDASTVPDEVLLQSTKILADIFINHEHEDIPKLLADKFGQLFGDYEWRVLVNAGEVSIDRDVWIVLGLDGFEFYGQEDTYLVYGIRKSASHT